MIFVEHSVGAIATGNAVRYRAMLRNDLLSNIQEKVMGNCGSNFYGVCSEIV